MLHKILDFFRPVPKQRKIKIRRNTGVIFNNLSGVKKSVFYVADMLLIGAVLGLIYTFQPLVLAYLTYWRSDNKNEEVTVAEEIKNEQEPVKNLALGSEAWIKIPKIEAESRIVAEVSPFDADEYEKALINNEVAAAKGTDWPGQGKGTMTYLFAHSTGQGLLMARNNAVFYLLGEMESGDKFLVGDQDQVLIYEVFDKKIIKANEIEYLDYREKESEIIILQTCWPIGTDWKRLLVFGRRLGI